MAKIKTRIRTEFGMKIKDIGIKNPLLSLEVSRKTLASLLFPKLTGKRFQHWFQCKQKFKAILTAKMALNNIIKKLFGMS